jgi:hypothetical protein
MSIIYVKNKKIYFGDYVFYNMITYEFFQNKLSVILVPIFLFILLHKKYIEYFSYMFLVVAIIGTIDTIKTYYLYMKTRNIYTHILFIFCAIIHLIFLYPLTNIEKYMKPNIINFLLGLLGLLIITFLPYWPYELKRTTMALLIILIYILSIFLYKFNSKTDTKFTSIL